MVGVDFPEGIHLICIAVQADDLFLCPADGELASVLNVLGIGKVEGLIFMSVASLSEKLSSLWSTALKCFSCRLEMLTRWSTHLLFDAI